MKKLFLMIFFIPVLFATTLFAQQTKKTPVGLGIEVGLGYNSMNVTAVKNNGEDTVLHYNSFWVQPCFRLHYDIPLKNFGISNSLKLKTFLGYYTFGGKLKLNDNGDFNIRAFASIEAGVGLSIDIKNMFQISPLFKAQYVVSANERYIRSTSKPAVDIMDDTNPFSYNAGLQFRFKYRHFTVGVEGWYGLADIHKSGDMTAKEINGRLLIGYEF